MNLDWRLTTGYSGEYLNLDWRLTPMEVILMRGHKTPHQIQDIQRCRWENSDGGLMNGLKEEREERLTFSIKSKKTNHNDCL